MNLYKKSIQIIEEKIESKADKIGNLPEQISENVLYSEFYSKWVEKKGNPAKTLLWSHAIYIILKKALMK